MNKMVEFRKMLAENGIEMTLQQASDAYLMAKKIIRHSKKMSTKDLWNILDVEAEGISKEEKEQIMELYQMAKEL